MLSEPVEGTDTARCANAHNMPSAKLWRSFDAAMRTPTSLQFLHLVTYASRMQLSTEFWTDVDVDAREVLHANDNVRVALADADIELSRYAASIRVRSCGSQNFMSSNFVTAEMKDAARLRADKLYGLRRMKQLAQKHASKWVVPWINGQKRIRKWVSIVLSVSQIDQALQLLCRQALMQKVCCAQQFFQS